MDIKRISATDAKNRFSDLLDSALDHPVRIDRSGKAAAYVVNAEDFDQVRASIALARIDRQIAAQDATLLDTLRAYSSGRLSRQKTMERLLLDNYGQLLSALDRAGISRPQVAKDVANGMAKGIEEVLRG